MGASLYISVHTLLENVEHCGGKPVRICPYITRKCRALWGASLYVSVHTLLENVEHCGGEPEQADRILMSDVTYSKFSVQCKLTQ